MKHQIETEDLFREAKSGNKSAENRFYSALIVRFKPVVKCELERFPILKKGLQYLEETSQEISSKAVEEIKVICPIGHPRWSLIRAVHVLRNITEDYILELLVDLARNGDAQAENLLFSIIRKKLMQRIEIKSWKAPG